MSDNPFSDWLCEVSNDDVVVNEMDLDSECRQNMWAFSLSFSEAKQTTTEMVTRFIWDVIESRRSQLSGRGQSAESMLFYCWHDEQAGQLRFSMISVIHGSPPFGAKIRFVDEPDEIIQSWLSSPYLNGFPWRHTHLVQPDEVREDVAAEHMVRVWTYLI